MVLVALRVRTGVPAGRVDRVDPVMTGGRAVPAGRVMTGGRAGLTGGPGVPAVQGRTLPHRRLREVPTARVALGAPVARVDRVDRVTPVGRVEMLRSLLPLRAEPPGRHPRPPARRPRRARRRCPPSEVPHLRRELRQPLRSNRNRRLDRTAGHSMSRIE